ncbi:RTA1 protein [Pseudovirgaria hyperparasitica]|uniref:RTA1 protein n=1 Tax=Pseudovirgaria hyperparasitica TaxID=470096 RepID=A0A6A6W3U0_9PEZI|nr:RTA1 protein [Pseudovirgaria hyperparasitica]KAF2755711.1 RTA1 protein [Pseudovirgaria hyperparasitica]
MPVLHIFSRQTTNPSDQSCSEDARPQIYGYEPNEFAAYLFLVLFSISTLIHLLQVLKTRTWFWIAFILGGVLEIIGFAGRVIGVTQTPCYTITVYIVMTLGTLLAPTLFAASIYMEFSRIAVLARGEHLSIVRPSWVTKIFVFGDILSFIFQAAGGGLRSSENADTADIGNTVIIIGLWIQIVFFGLFMINSIIWWTRMKTRPSSLARDVPWQKHLIVLFVASFLILVRSVFRVIEYMEGRGGYLITHEVFFYCFDIALMFLLMAGFHYWHPSEIIALNAGGKYIRLWKTHDVKKYREGHSMSSADQPPSYDTDYVSRQC